MTQGLTLAEVAREIPGVARLVGDGAVRVSGVHHDSRHVAPGDLFVARKGVTSDGTAFVGAAKAKGAVAVLAAEGTVDPSATGLPTILVADVADGLAYAAAAVYGHPAFSLEIVGVTGTNGKTTTTHLVRAAIDAATGRAACGLVGTVGHSFAGRVTKAAHTTPEADELARILAEMRAAGASHVAMEVSSIALELGRVRAIRFRVGAFTNLTQDHLDFHGTMDAYAAAKRSLFFASAPGAAVINVADPFGRALAGEARAPLVKVSPVVGADADIAPVSATMDERGIQAVLRTPRGEVRLSSGLVGAHNLENLVVAMGVAFALDLDLERAAQGLSSEGGAPGRLERCDGPGDDLTVLVDYAHTPDAVERVLDSVRRVSKGRVWCVFGCGGDRDPSKRGPMGRAAALGADVVVVTTDNPRTEEPGAIAAPIVAAVRAAGLSEVAFGGLSEHGRAFVVELDRARAIDGAIHAAQPGDVVVIAGKGHEDYQIVGTTKHPFDDREVARNALLYRRDGRAK